MRKAIVSFPYIGGAKQKKECHVIETPDHVKAYGEMYPSMHVLLAGTFLNILEEGEKIIVHSNGSWCTENDDISIVKYLDAPNWSVEKKDEIEKQFIDIVTQIGMDIPSNFEDIVQHIYEDVCETADPENWSQGDVAIGFRRWIESKA